MPRIYLSPSTQEFNPYVIGGNEAEIAEKFLDMLRHLSKKDLISERAEAKREAKEAVDKQRKEDEAEISRILAYYYLILSKNRTMSSNCR